jgi:hypothetical protein
MAHVAERGRSNTRGWEEGGVASATDGGRADKTRTSGRRCLLDCKSCQNLGWEQIETDTPAALSTLCHAVGSCPLYDTTQTCIGSLELA